MHKITRVIVLLSSFLLMLGVDTSRAVNIPGSKDSPSKTGGKMSTKSSPAGRKSTVEHMKRFSNKSINHVLASAEELSGTIAFIGPSDKEVTLVGANGIPYDFQLTPKSRIDLAGKKIGVSELPAENHKGATVRFLPTTRGNLAETVKISAS